MEAAKKIEKKESNNYYLTLTFNKKVSIADAWEANKTFVDFVKKSNPDVVSIGSIKKYHDNFIVQMFLENCSNLNLNKTTFENVYNCPDWTSGYSCVTDVKMDLQEYLSDYFKSQKNILNATA